MTELTKDQFLKYVQDHRITVNMDNGVYRDFTIKKPNTVSDHYNITTRPNHLIVTGDRGSYIFHRHHDMLSFFRDTEDYYINPCYWHEKLKSDNHRGSKEFSLESVHSILSEHLNEYVQENDLSSFEKRAATKAIADLIGLASDSEEEFYSRLQSWDEEKAGGLRMTDWWEWDFQDYTTNYLWICYAIVHAIKLYDAHKLDSRRALFESEILANLRGDLELVFDVENQCYAIPNEARKLGVEGAAQDILLHRIDGAYMGWMKAMEKNNAIN